MSKGTTRQRPSSAGPATRMTALLRGINVGGNRLVPMAALRELASDAGLLDVASYIQSGNLVFTAHDDAAAVEAALEAALAARFGFSVDVIVRTAAEWARHAAGGPFADAARERPKLLHLGLCKRPPRPDAAAQLQARAGAGERVALADGALWLDYAGGVARSRLSPAVLDKAVGSPVTARNWNTVLTLQTMLAGAEAPAA